MEAAWKRKKQAVARRSSPPSTIAVPERSSAHVPKAGGVNGLEPVNLGLPDHDQLDLRLKLLISLVRRMRFQRRVIDVALVHPDCIGITLVKVHGVDERA